MDFNAEREAERRIRENIRIVFGGDNKKNLPVLPGHKMDPLNPSPFLPHVLGHSTSITLAEWVDGAKLFEALGFTGGQAMLIGNHYTVSTEVLDKKLQEKRQQLHRSL